MDSPDYALHLIAATLASWATTHAILDLIQIWRTRPRIVFDDHHGRWRAARTIHHERNHR